MKRFKANIERYEFLRSVFVTVHGKDPRAT